MSHALFTGLTPKQLESIQELWEIVASMPNRQIERHIEHLRKVAILLEIDADDFYEYTGGFYLYEMDDEMGKDSYYDR